MKLLDCIEAGMLLALWHLRYLTSTQIQGLWFKDRTLGATQKRLSRLKAAGILDRVRWFEDEHRAAWLVGIEGLRWLRRNRQEEFQPTKPLSVQFIQHLIDTNQVFFILAGDERVWGRLPFVWRGSHETTLPYGRYLSADRGLDQRQAVIRADAVVEPRGALRRIFIELDRSTECIAAKEARRSIEGKLDAYRQSLHGRNHDGQTWHAATLRDRRVPHVLFLASKNDTSCRDPALRDRRIQSIEKAAEKVFGFTHRDWVTVTSLRSCAAIRQVLGLASDAGVAPPAPAPKSASPKNSALETYIEAVSHVGTVRGMEQFYRCAVQAYHELPRDSKARQDLKVSAFQMRELLLKARAAVVGTPVGEDTRRKEIES